MFEEKQELTEDEKSFVDTINDIYKKTHDVSMLSGIVPNTTGLSFAHKIYEKMYPDKYTEAREIENKMKELRDDLAYVLGDSDCY